MESIREYSDQKKGQGDKLITNVLDILMNRYKLGGKNMCVLTENVIIFVVVHHLWYNTTGMT
jgi:hypothetical protein